VSNIEFLSSALAEQCHRVDALQDAVEECLPAYQLGEEVGDEANHIERIEYAGEEIRDLQRDLATARDHLRVSEEQVEALGHMNETNVRLEKERDHVLSLSLERYQEIEEIRATMGEANQQMGRATAARDHYRSIAEVGVYAAGSACPCKHTAPCSDRCTCVDPLSSSGCLRCCSYGSPEQRKAQAERLAACEEARALTGDLRGYTMTADEIRALAEQCLLWEPKDWTDPACLRCAERAIVLARALLDRLPVVEAAVEWADSDGCDDLNDPAATALGAAVNALRAWGE